MARSRLTLFLCTVLLSTCARQDPALEVALHEDPYPEKLSAWGLLYSDERFLFASGVEPYDINMPLFTDYAHKLRTLYIPSGQAASYEPEDAFDFPAGTIISKTFFYLTTSASTNGTETATIALRSQWDGDPGTLDHDRVQLIETRLLVRQDSGWDALPYIWRGDDAYLAIGGDLFTLDTNEGDLNYLVPSRNQCASCHATNHTTGAIEPIGLKARHLNRGSPTTTENQLSRLADRGALTGLPGEIPQAASWTRKTDTLAHKARSYLDINCGHCHNALGAADTSGLLLDYKVHDERDLGVCKPPIAAGRGSGGHLYSIIPGDADASIMTFRLATTDPAAMMPELGRSLAHKEGLALVADWINSLDGQCL